MLSRTLEWKMRTVRMGLLLAWFILIISLFWDPLTPALTAPDNVRSPFHLGETAVVVQGRGLRAEPYAMGNRIFWTMILPLVPLALMLFGHETWRRVCPLSLVSQFPRMLGWERKTKRLNRNSGRVEHVLALLPTESWVRLHHRYFQFGFLALGVLGRILFYNSDRIALAAAFALVMSFALIVGLLYGGKTWCNYFCPVAVIQAVYTGPGGLLDSKAHIAPSPIGQSMCRAPGLDRDQSSCVGCTTNCPDVDLENSYWKSIESDQKRFMYYGLFGLIFAFYTYYYVYSGGWDYYMSGAWTHESGQFSSLFAPGFYLGGFSAPIPKFVAAPLYFGVCIAVAFCLLVLVERGYARLSAWRGKPLSKMLLRHRMLTVCAFLSITLFYRFAGRPNILLMPPWVVNVIDFLIVFVTAAWLFRSLARNPDMYRREHLGKTLREQLVRMGFRSEDALEGRPIDQLSADEVYVLAKTLPNFSVTQKRQAYRGILIEVLETGQTKSAESLRTLSDVRAQLGLSDADHAAIAEALGIEDPTLFDSARAQSMEQRLLRENYRKFLLDLTQRSLAAGVKPAIYLASEQALEVTTPVRTLYSISEDEHARIIAEVTQDETRFVDRARKLLEAFRQIEALRFSLRSDLRPEARLSSRALLLRQNLLVREIVSVIASISEPPLARSLAQSAYMLIGKDGHGSLAEAIGALPEDIRYAFQHLTSDPILASYLDVVEASMRTDDVFGVLASDRDPNVATLAVSALAAADPARAASIVAELWPSVHAQSPFLIELRRSVSDGQRPDAVVVMAELLKVDAFACLDLGALANIASHSALATYAVGEQICRLGESPDTMFVLVDGETEAWVNSDQGRIVLGRGKAGIVFGELGVITGRPRSASVEVLSISATVVAIPREVIDDLLGRDLHAARGILSIVSGYLLDTISVTSGSAQTVDREPVTAR